MLCHLVSPVVILLSIAFSPQYGYFQNNIDLAKFGVASWASVPCAIRPPRCELSKEVRYNWWEESGRMQKYTEHIFQRIWGHNNDVRPNK